LEEEMKSARRIIAVVLVLFFAGMFLGCKKNETSQAASGQDGPFRITLMVRQGMAEPPTSDNAVIKEIEKITNTVLDIDWVPSAAYPEKFSVTVASNDYPMVVLVEGGSKPSVLEIECIRNGVFWKISDYINDPKYKWLAELDPTTMQNAMVDGELWGLFRTRPSVRNGLYYRKDWADNLGLGEPKNLEDLYNMVYAFVHNDPDGNGQNDTHGIAQESYLRNHFATLHPLFGLGNGWDVIDGKLAAVHTEPGYLDMLKYIKRFYDDGLMNRDFPTVTENQRNEMMSDNYGMAITTIEKGQQSIVSLQKLHPNADFHVMTNFEGYPLSGLSGFESKFYISKKSVPNEADVRRIIDYFELMHSPEINNLIYNGFEGAHYTKVSANEITASAEQREKYTTEVNPVEQLGFRFRKNNYTVANTPYYQGMVDYFNYVYQVPLTGDPTFTLDSPTQNEQGTELQQLIWDAGVQFITGAINESGWWAAVDRWRRDGGDNMTAEYQAQYDALRR
jgi:putative aldouronate transport system substrate-binding protein